VGAGDGGRRRKEGEALAHLLPHGKYPRVSLGSLPPQEVLLKSSVVSDASTPARSLPGTFFFAQEERVVLSVSLQCLAVL
jgi:hypothetical protein